MLDNRLPYASKRNLRTLLACACFGALASAAPSASAFSTRVHIAIANDVRKTLIASGDNSIPLRGSQYSVILDPADAQAIIDHPLEFRAGAVGPDNIAFPGMTDPSHAIGQRPFEQCQALYQEAILPEEKAYALGCFLHGSTDAVAHHWVNYMTGETFTLNPISAGRASSFDNVVRHITAESMIQHSALLLDSERFTAGELAHTIPKGFLLRAYFDETSSLYSIIAGHAKAEFDAEKAANPGGSLVTWLGGAKLAPADHLILAPVYLREIDAERQELKKTIQDSIADKQDPSTPDGAVLGVTAGSDGKLGTPDDETACSASCPTLYATYKVYVALLAPRFDAAQNPLPSAFDKLSDELRDDLFQFLPAYVQTIENVSSKLNEPITSSTSGLGFSKSDIPVLFQPLTTWSNDLTSIDYLTLTQAVLPDWLIDLENALNLVGVNVDLAQIFSDLMDPFISPIKDAIKQYAVDQVQQIVGELVDAIEAKKGEVEAEYTTRLQAAAPASLGGVMLDHLYESGLYMHSFNIAATGIAKRESVLPVGEDPVGIGPATFDAAHTLSWMQLGLCDYLREAVFPLGIDARAGFSVKTTDGQTHMATLEDDSPIECHEGSLSAFTTTPSVTSCHLVKLDALVSDAAHLGSVSRSFPPEFGDPAATCVGIAIPGLPDPPPGIGGSGGGSGGSVSSGDPDSSSGDDGGCGCRTSSSSTSGGSALALLVALGLYAFRRRRGHVRAASVALLVAACGGDDGGGSAPGSGGTGAVAGSGATGGTGGASGSGASGGAGATGGTGGSGAGAAVLIESLGKSVWSSMQTRNGKQRAVELRFDAPSLFWAEIVNPFGPARQRTMRTMNIEADGATVHTTVITPPGWPVTPDNGKKEDFTLTVIDGSPRKLEIATANGTEQYDELPWPAPSGGLTAILRVFPPGGPMAGAFCEKGSLNGPDRDIIWAFARGESSEEPTGVDVVAGVELDAWIDATGQNQFAVTNVPGFDQLGGTDLSDQFNFVVLYTGTLTHPGGNLSMRELDDDVKDGVWAFVGPSVGSSNLNDVFLEVHGHAPADLTVDAPTTFLAPGDVPVEVMILRCSEQLQDIDVEVDTGGGWMLVGDHPSKPRIDDVLFPPAL
jgi:MYXO-CTERM domain-containing protein